MTAKQRRETYEKALKLIKKKYGYIPTYGVGTGEMFECHCLCGNALAGIVLGVQTWAGTGVALAATALDIAVLLGLLWTALRMRGVTPRFTQAATALLGAGILFTLLAMPLQPLLDTPEEIEGGALLYLLLLIWVQLVYGHVLRHALNVTLVAGVALALVYTFTSAVMIELFFPLPAT